MFGYFRECHSKYFISDNPYYSLQPLLIYTCIAYYLSHEWDTQHMSDQIEIDDDNMITKTGRGHTSVFVEGTISSGCHKYEFKLVDCALAVCGWFDIVIGLIPIQS